jgi:pimeloyl-ACP methyl ester carboxylesterase
MTNTEPAAFKVEIPQSKVDEILNRVKTYPWFAAPNAEGDTWAYGANMSYMKELADHWVNKFSWADAEKGLNRFPQFKVTIDGQEIHYIHEVGSGDNPTPLIITHGWPGSFYEFLEVIDPLAHPDKYGGDAADAFTVIVPSMPGYGFSGKPENPIGPGKVAEYFSKLMGDVLGFDTYVAQGGDWGSVVTGCLGYFHDDKCKAIHLNMLGLRPPHSANLIESDEEKKWEATSGAGFQAEGAYFLAQATKPQSLALGMMDSPVGIASWFCEKFNTWSDVEGQDLQSVYTKDQLLTNIMVYLVNDSFFSSIWMYRGMMEDPGTVMSGGKTVTIPTGIAVYKDGVYPMPPRSYVEKGYNVVHYETAPKGGHFAALEQPEFYIADVQAFKKTAGV